MGTSKIKLFGLAIALAGAAGAEEAAADVSIPNATNTPLSTSSSGDITVASGGSIAVTANQTAITVDSDNDVTVALGGSLTSTNANATRGIVIQGGTTGAVIQNGAISLLEDYTMTDADSDGDFDGTFATGLNRVGILLESGTFIGDITTGASSSITIEGNESAAIRLDGLLDGDLNADGAIKLTGDNGSAISIGADGVGGVTGDAHILGDLTVLGTASSGVLVDAAIGGVLDFTSSVSVTGFHSISRPTTDAALAKLDDDDLRVGGSAVDVRYSVGGGILFHGTGVEDDLDDDGDGVLETDDDPNTTDDTDDDQSATLVSYGSAPVLTISPSATAPADILIGANTVSGFGVENRGVLRAVGIFDGFAATGVNIEGAGANTVTVEGGLLNDGTISAESAEANSYAVHIGDLASVPTVINRKIIASSSFSEGDFSAFGILVDGTATVPAVENTGLIKVELRGETGDAVAIGDHSNSVSTITNSGSIIALITATDDDPTDDVTPTITGHAYAIDVGASTIDVTVNQVADTPFTDDDTVDNDKDERPSVAITGDIRLGSGNDTINLGRGTITGDIQFGDGADTLHVTGNATFTGLLADSDNDLSLDVVNGAVLLDAGAVTLTSASFGANGRLGVVLSPEAGQSTEITVSGPVTFADGAQIVPTVPLGLPEAGSVTFLTATGGLTGEENVVGVIDDAFVPFLYDVSIDVVDGQPNSLEAIFAIKSAGDLGLNTNQAIALNPILAGLRDFNADAAAALSSLTTQFEFDRAYQDLMPSYASSAAELAATAIQQQQSTASNRLSAYRLGQVRDKSVWGQEIAYGLNRDPSDINAQEFRGYGFGFAAGFDAPTESGAILGGSASFITSQVEEPGRSAGEISATFGQINGYMGTSLGALNVDLVAGAGIGQMQSRRFIQIGDSFNALSEAEWWSYEGHGAVHVSLPVELGAFTLTPRTALTYVALNEQDYTESGAGDGLDYQADSALSQRLWGDAALELSARFGREDDPRANVIAPRVMVGYRANLIDEGADRTFRIASGGDEFTLTDQSYGDGGVLAGFGLTAGNAYSSFSLAYEGEFGDELSRHSLNASVRINF